MHSIKHSMQIKNKNSAKQNSVALSPQPFDKNIKWNCVAHKSNQRLICRKSRQAHGSNFGYTKHEFLFIIVWKRYKMQTEISICLIWVISYEMVTIVQFSGWIKVETRHLHANFGKPAKKKFWYAQNQLTREKEIHPKL